VVQELIVGVGLIPTGRDARRLAGSEPGIAPVPFAEIFAASID
jgi:hypothetical protein